MRWLRQRGWHWWHINQTRRRPGAESGLVGGAPSPGVRVHRDSGHCWHRMHCAVVLGAARAASTAPLLRARLLGMARRAMATSLLRVPPPQGLLQPLTVPERLLLGPGPSNVPPRILAAGGQQLLGHMHPEVLQVSCPSPAFLSSPPLPRPHEGLGQLCRGEGGNSGASRSPAAAGDG